MNTEVSQIREIASKVVNSTCDELAERFKGRSFRLITNPKLSDKLRDILVHRDIVAIDAYSNDSLHYDTSVISSVLIRHSEENSLAELGYSDDDLLEIAEEVLSLEKACDYITIYT